MRPLEHLISVSHKQGLLIGVKGTRKRPGRRPLKRWRVTQGAQVLGALPTVDQPLVHLHCP